MNSNRPMNATPRQEAVRVLMLGYPDAFVEFYSNCPLQVHHATLPSTSVAGEIAAEKAMEQSLPPQFQPLFEPRYRRFSAVLRPVTIQQMIDAQLDRARWKALTRFFGELKSGRQDEEAVAWV